ncbi:GNAT family N-acetyltransferase [Actinokineospora iranica]|uniref:Ribosomal protein S18 acetylase RimI n=1 Tax=Actinokineospora iranica TaxID=1271860 RepID=A0A1G6S2G9_9PSEU|nr:GNAT family N-acetyltransferase [Actinokineospora iranica]SDD11058.1 Ribosomal protein S18 acetylase RimI [Actinokineospora iranica]
MTGYELRAARPEDAGGARSVILDTLYRDLRYGYNPVWHEDVIDIEGIYLRPARHALFVAEAGGEIVATTGVRAVGPKSPPHPRWLAERYPDESTAQLFRVYVRPSHRRNGLARGLVELAVRFVAQTPGYQALYLHTDARVQGAESFWRSVAKQVHDGRDGDPAHFQTVHFEIPIP